MADDLRFERILLPGDSSQNSVRGIAQDQQGFLWLATVGGLVRYDGYEFTTYTCDPLDSTSLSHDRVECLYVDRAGTLWVGTFTRHRFDPGNPGRLRRPHLKRATGEASIASSGIMFVQEDQSGALWIGAHVGGLNGYDPATETLLHFRPTRRIPAA